jgi:hypothetical protein
MEGRERVVRDMEGRGKRTQQAASLLDVLV